MPPSHRRTHHDRQSPRAVHCDACGREEFGRSPPPVCVPEFNGARDAACQRHHEATAEVYAAQEVVVTIRLQEETRGKEIGAARPRPHSLIGRGMGGRGGHPYFRRKPNLRQPEPYAPVAVVEQRIRTTVPTPYLCKPLSAHSTALLSTPPSHRRTHHDRDGPSAVHCDACGGVERCCSPLTVCVTVVFSAPSSREVAC